METKVCPFMSKVTQASDNDARGLFEVVCLGNKCKVWAGEANDTKRGWCGLMPT